VDHRTIIGEKYIVHKTKLQQQILP